MKVILVNGSPHQHGCTYTALATEIAHTLQEKALTARSFGSETSPSAVIGCHGCVKLGKCAFDDDPVNAFTAKARQRTGSSLARRYTTQRPPAI